MTSWVPASLANHVWQSTLFVAFVWLVTLALRRHDARVRYWLWAAASVKFFLPFSWLISLGALIQWRTAPAIAQPAATFVMQEILAPPLLFGAVSQVPQDTNIGRWVVLGVWLAGTAVVCLCWGRQWRLLRSALRCATPLRLDPDCDAGPLPVMSSPSAFEPGVVGILRPVLLVPEGLVDHLTRPQLDAILAHERAHVRAHDNLLAVVHMAVEAIFWFHPLVWWIERRMIDERERACDEAVVRAGKRPADYAEGILAVCRWSVESPVMCVSGVTGSDLRTRIETIMANRLGRRLHKTGRVLLAGAALIVLGGPVGVGLFDAAAQEQTVAKPQFEVPESAESEFDVASIKQNVSRSFPVGPETRPGGSFIATNATVERIIRFAYDLPEYRLVGGPDWVRNDGFDVEARAGRDASAEELRRMVQALLRDRFQIVVRWEQKEMPIYTLLPARDDKRLGPNLRQSGAGCALPEGPGLTGDERRTPNGGVATRRTCASMAVLVSILSNALRVPVDDKTTLTGLWDYELRFTGERRRSTSQAAAARDPNDAPALFTAVQEQLGLKLESGRGPVNVLVIESAARPSEN